MDLSMKSVGDVTIVAIRGSVDGLTADRLLEQFNEQVEGGQVRLVADCSALDYTSSAGLRTLLGTVKAARRKGGDLRLAAVRPQVLKVLELAGFTSILKTYPDVEAAVASFAQ
jgi:anti-sigma B factor antagonist